MLTDAPLLRPPGQLALAAVRSALSRQGVRLRKYLVRAAARAQEAAGGSGSGGAGEVQRLERALAELDELGAAGASPVPQEEAAVVDRKVKAARAPGLAAAERQRRAAAKAEKAAAKAARRAQERAAREAELGILPPASAAVGEGRAQHEERATKRAKAE